MKSMDMNVNYERYLTYVEDERTEPFWRVSVPIPSRGIKKCNYEKLGDYVDKIEGIAAVHDYFLRSRNKNECSLEIALRSRIRSLEEECKSWREQVEVQKREKERLQAKCDHLEHNIDTCYYPKSQPTFWGQ